MFYWCIVGFLIWFYYMVCLPKGRAILTKVLWDVNSEPASKEIAVTLGNVVAGFILTIFLWPIVIYKNEFRKK